MSEESKKIEKIEQEVKASELSEQDLDKVAGGGGGLPVGKVPVTGGGSAGGVGGPVVGKGKSTPSTPGGLPS